MRISRVTEGKRNDSSKTIPPDLQGSSYRSCIDDDRVVRLCSECGGAIGAAAFFVGSAIRVIPHDYVEIKWVADVSWRGFVELFEDPDGEGPLLVRVDSVDGAGAPIIGTDHVVRISVALLQPDHLILLASR